MQDAAVERHSITEKLCSLPTFVLLLIVLFLGVAEMGHARIVILGETIWSDYYMLRADPSRPTCDPNENLDKLVQQAVAEKSAEEDEFDLFGDEIDPVAIRKSFENSQALCQVKHDMFEETNARITPALKAFRWAETSVAKVVAVGVVYKKHLLVFIILVAALATTVLQHHIALRPVKTFKDHMVSNGAQLLANGMLLFSSVMFYRNDVASVARGVDVKSFDLHYMWILGFSLMVAANIRHLLRPPEDLSKQDCSFLLSLCAAPLYTLMCLISGFTFMSAGNYAGISIYLAQMIELATLFINLGLYIWIGMLLKNTQFADRCMDVVREWKCRPEVLALVLLFITVIPTAYTGASGIFVIAAGGIIYHELRSVGARRQFSLAVTAMSGSMGVIFRPCLLVVIVAALNTQVTTDELYGWGVKVFFITLMIFFAVAMLTKTKQDCEVKESVAIDMSIDAVKVLIPYVLIAAAFILFFTYVLDTNLNEFNAPLIIPFILLTIMCYEKVLDFVFGESEASVRNAVRNSNNQATVHIGALLMLMALSVSFGGVIERTELMMFFPQGQESLMLTVFLLVCILILIGMVMDPYGAVILVSVTLAPIAYKYGINAVHFWMIALVAFELGYLSPPVALNHLLTRQVVGVDEVDLAYSEPVNEGRLQFWYRHERFLLPIAVVGSTLILVAYVPFLFIY